jgi:hypothetical protein
MCVFGAAAGSIFNLIINRAEGRNAWETGMYDKEKMFASHDNV